MHALFVKSVSVAIFFLTGGDAASPPNKQGELQVQLSGWTAAEGSVLLAVYDRSEDFLSENRYRELAVPLTSREPLTVRVGGLPFGRYAISAFHDANDNAELDTNFLGIPKESYGFSNNARGRFGPPSFEQAAFEFDTAAKQITIDLR